MSQSNGKKFNRDEFRRRKAQRDAAQPAEWITNPETGNEFYVRRVGLVGYAISALLPHNMTEAAVASWQQLGVVPEGAVVPKVDPATTEKTLKLIHRVVTEACVSPRIFPGADAEDALDPIEVPDSDLLFIFRHATRQINATVMLKGGGEVKIEDLQTFSEQPGERAGASLDSPELQPAAQ